jgi:hypothetical protein
MRKMKTKDEPSYNLQWPWKRVEFYFSDSNLPRDKFLRETSEAGAYTRPVFSST